ncbi:MAG: HAD family hydrolase [Ornithinimicrobium sp.]
MLIATDLDGTLVPNGDTTPTPYCADVLRRLDRAGVPVVFVTGRPLRWMTGFWPYVGRPGVAIVSNGAVAYDVHGEAVIEHVGISPAVGLGLVASISDTVPGATFAIECLDGIRRDSAYRNTHRVPEGSPRGPLEDLWDAPALKLLVRNALLDDEEFRERVVSVVGDQATPTWSIAGLVEVSANGVTKASALTTLCARLGVPPAEVVAFGDMPNDIPMLRWAGTSYAMTDSHSSVRAVADHVAPPCHADGVARVLESFLTAGSDY